MSDSPDESRLRATEAQMRRALGLQESAPSPPAPAVPPAVMPGMHRPARRFVRDGEVTVSLTHRDDLAGSNPLQAARQALQAQTQAREQAERQLADAQAMIRDLQTKLAHERMAKDEATQRTSAEKQASVQALEEMRVELSAARAACQQTEQRLQKLVTRRENQRALQDLPAGIAGTKPGREGDAGAEITVEEVQAPARRRGRPPRVSQPEPDSDIVEWWKPGWQDRYR
jgi:hypothetical protein